MFDDEVIEAVNEDLYTISAAKRHHVYAALFAWFTNEVLIPSIGKKSEQQARNYFPKLEELSKNLTVEIADEAYVVKAAGNTSDTLSELRRGTLWFNPHPDIDGLVLREILK